MNASLMNWQLNGLVLAGGKSRRMGRDKGSLIYPHLSSLDQRSRFHAILSLFCKQTFLSVRPSQAGALHTRVPLIVDSVEGEGPGVGLLSAHFLVPDASWLVLACDLINATANDVRALCEAHFHETDQAFRTKRGGPQATCYRHENSISEPLFAIWTPDALCALKKDHAAAREKSSPQKTLSRLRVQTVLPAKRSVLLNVNEPHEAMHNRVLQGADFTA